MLKHKKFCAFSLVELMAAVAVVSILVTLALPRYRLFITSSRQAEAQANLGIIATLQQTYQLKDGNHYTTPVFNMGNGTSSGGCGDSSSEGGNLLGFRVADCDKLRYTYSPTSGGGSALHDQTSPLGALYPNCPATTYTDEWSINAERKLKHDDDIVEDCRE